MKFAHAKTNEILQWFEQITKIPRCSKKEEQIRSWLMEWAKAHQLVFKTDAAGNLLVKVPASPGYEHAPLTVIQGHLDMVCEKTPDSDHDFTKDPIKLIYDGDWLKADKTTLGADNGIAIAMAMTLAVSNDVAHPPLELLFTVDEETGLTGANALQPGFIDGKILINLDSEDEGVFTVGCAGGMNTTSTVPVQFEAIPSGYQGYKLTGSGMKGGHSGVNIKEQRANAIKVTARVLDAIRHVTDMRMAHIQGGRAHNAIPRDCEAVIFFPKGDWEKVKKEVARQEQILKSEYKNTDPEMKISIEPNGAGKFNQVFTASDTRKVIDFLLVMPHGVAAMSTDIPGLVETSNNLANITVENHAVKVLTSQRSSIVSRLQAITQRIEALARLAGGEARSGDGYPPWPPRMDSPLLALCKDLYRRMFGKDPIVEVIHAGLECGIIGDKNPGMDMISIGPDLKNPHSPDEKISIPAIGKVWDFLVELLKELKGHQALA